MATLEAPGTAGELYLYRGDDVPRSRPLFQGDVFDGVEIPGFDDGSGLAMVVTHACSMRRGPELLPRLLVGRVAPHAGVPLPWSGNFRIMPLPDLLETAASSHWALNFEDLGSVATTVLDLSRRIACLDDRGVVLLQQRHAHHLTRYVVETSVLFEQSAGVIAEASLLESWLDAALDDADVAFAATAATEAAAFDEFLTPLRQGLMDPSRRASVRRAVLQETARRFGG